MGRNHPVGMDRLYVSGTHDMDDGVQCGSGCVVRCVRGKEGV